jgi:tRNA A37 methylthiotransferase MiaB
MLTRMRRNHTREVYLDLVDRIRSEIPGVAISTDMIVGFCDETEQEFLDTLNLVKEVEYDFGFLFAYSMREKTHAHRKMEDNVPEEVKNERLKQLIDVFRQHQLVRSELEIGSH